MEYAYEIDVFIEESHTLSFWVYVQTVVLGLCTLFWPEGFLQIDSPAAMVLATIALVGALWFSVVYALRTVVRYVRMWWEGHSLTAHRTTIRFWLGILGFGGLISTISIVYLSPLLPHELPHHALFVVLKVLHLG